MAAPIGNKNAAKPRVWTDAIRRVLTRLDSEAPQRDAKIDQLALVLINKAMEGDMQAIKEVGDRLEGKPAQAIEATVEHVEQEKPERATMTREEWLKNHGIVPHVSH